MLKHTTLAALLLAGGVTGAFADPVKIGLQPWLGYGPLWVAQEKGFFAAHGVDVELASFNWDQDMTAALASGNLDVVAAATNTAIASFNHGVDQKAFLVMDVSTTADAILAGAGIADVAGLKGRKVAFESGATSDLLMNYALKVNGMSLADIEHVPMGASEAGLALLSGQVEAAVTYEPYISAALGKDASYKVIYNASEKPGLISDVLTARGDWIVANPALVEGMIKAWDDAVVFIREHPEEGGAMIAKAVGSPMEDFIPGFKGVHLYDAAENAALVTGDFPATLREIAEIMQTSNPGEITKIPALEDVMMTAPVLKVAGK
ncbi:ABC transporter substrate-binding protein [Rhodobacter capsulatus]|uniref:ABC transporter substrate-binding protein n=1 Tax=Rhodobacter capsulatus TaxID=1061 RepID=A0A4U1JNH1_RHOCA|nr:ABC transporter substrate-binding protein [Rhodobacter capsulatus]TKD17467.1 ABC transporter substrate-binding protein [Rhodobacter capsulatus]